MTARVTRVFRDRYTGALYAPGTLIEIPETARLADLAGRGLVDIIKEPEPETPEDAPKKKKKK